MQAAHGHQEYTKTDDYGDELAPSITAHGVDGVLSDGDIRDLHDKEYAAVSDNMVHMPQYQADVFGGAVAKSRDEALAEHKRGDEGRSVTIAETIRELVRSLASAPAGYTPPVPGTFNEHNMRDRVARIIARFQGHDAALAFSAALLAGQKRHEVIYTGGNRKDTRINDFLCEAVERAKVSMGLTGGDATTPECVRRGTPVEVLQAIGWTPPSEGVFQDQDGGDRAKVHPVIELLATRPSVAGAF